MKVPLTRAGMGLPSVEDSAAQFVMAEGGAADAVQRLLDMEAIKQLKAAYFRCLDTGNFAELAQLFTDDVQVHFSGGGYEWKLRGRREYLAALRGAFNRYAVGHHNGHTPEITILNAREAAGLWYLSDHMWVQTPPAADGNTAAGGAVYTHGTALYWDRYTKRDGRWRIAQTNYRRIYEVVEQLPAPPPFTVRYLADAAEAAD